MINTQYFKNKKQGTLLVSLAGPMANVLLGWVFYNVLRFCTIYLPSTGLNRSLLLFFLVNVQVNLGLATFNLLPIPPLDGSHILESLLPPRLAYGYARLAPYGPFVLMILLISGGAQYIMNPIYSVLSHLLVRLSF